MIEFSCRCGYRFVLDDSLAGDSVQCLNCGLLNSVPGAAEAEGLAADGTYLLDEAPPPPPPSMDRLDELSHVFRKQRHDAQGVPIDLRHRGEPLPLVDPLSSAAALATGEDYRRRPRYDPETGELIRDIDLRPDPERQLKPASIPFAKAALTYAAADTVVDTGGWVRLLRLMAWLNLMVMFAVLMVHAVALWLTGLCLATRFVALIPLSAALQAAVLAHYGIVIEEAGVERNDELPRLLRNLELMDDLWRPFQALLFGLVLCFAPAVLSALAASLSPRVFLITLDVLMPLMLLLVAARLVTNLSNVEWKRIEPAEDIFQPLIGMVGGLLAAIAPAVLCVLLHVPQPVDWIVAAGLAAIGLCFVPGVLLTLTSSGTSANLRPDRLFRTIAACGPRYWLAAVQFAIAIPPYVAGQVILVAAVMSLVGVSVPLPKWMTYSLLAFPLISVGIILMHAFCWQLGMFYRLHHPQFPWLFQFHARVQRPSPPPRLHRAAPARIA